MENKHTSVLRHTMNRRKHKSMSTIGIAAGVLMLIGVVTVASFLIHLTGRWLDNTEKKEELERFLLPMVMLDPVTFDFTNPEQNADPEMILESSVWGALLSKSQDKFVRDDYGSIILPASDVDVQAAKMYGSAVTVQHQSFGSEYDILYRYDEDQKVYYIPVGYQMAAYTPRIMKISHKGDLYTLEVGYIPPGNLWQMDTDGKTYEPDPDKIMIVELKKVKGGYNIVALKDGPDTQAITSEPQQPSMPSQDPMLPEEGEPSEPASSEEEAEPKPIEFTKVTASSTLEASGRYTYDPENVLDGDPDTAWIEGEDGDGIGQWIMFEADEPQTLNGIRMTNGYTSSDFYEKNNRITKVKIEFSDGSSLVQELNGFEELCENGKPGSIPFGKEVTTQSVKITIEAVDAGSKYDDTCITMVEFY